MATIYTPKEMKFQMAEASVFKTGIADGVAAVELSGGIFTFTPDIKLVRPDRFRGQNVPDVFDQNNNVYGSIHTVQGETPALKTEIADFFYMMIQNVSEAVTPFQKTFTYPASSPDFAVNAGYFMTFWDKGPVAAESQKIDTVIGEKLEITINPEGDGFLNFNFTGRGIGYSRVADPSGALTKSVQTKFPFHQIAVCTLDGTAVLLQDLKITLENEITPVGFDGLGDSQNLHVKPKPPMIEIKGIWDASMRTQLGKFDSGVETVLILNWGSTGVDGFLGFEIHGNVDDGNHAEDALRGVNLTISGASDLENTEPILTAEICDAVDRTW